jgi:uncharacterized protein YjiS (DUF1127 family)
MVSGCSRVVALRTADLRHSRDEELAGRVLAGFARLRVRWSAWREARRRAIEAERWLQSASDRDLADIGLVRTHGHDSRGVPPDRLHGAWNSM